MRRPRCGFTKKLGVVGHERTRAPAPRDGFAIFYSLNTRWADNDIYGHINNVAYYAFFDSVVNRFLIEEGGMRPVR